MSFLLKCPKLIGLDISGFKSFANYLAELPSSVFEMIPALSGFLDEVEEMAGSIIPTVAEEFLPAGGYLSSISRLMSG